MYCKLYIYFNSVEKEKIWNDIRIKMMRENLPKSVHQLLDMLGFSQTGLLVKNNAIKCNSGVQKTFSKSVAWRQAYRISKRSIINTTCIMYLRKVRYSKHTVDQSNSLINQIVCVCTYILRKNSRSEVISEHLTHDFYCNSKSDIHWDGLNDLFSGRMVFSLLLHLTWRAK